MTKQKMPAPRVEVLPPQRQTEKGGPIEGIAISAFRRVRNKVIQKELESFSGRVRAWNDGVEALRDAERVRQEYELSIVRSENLPLLRAAEEARILVEVQKIFDDEADRALERKIKRTKNKAELERSKRDLEALRAQPGQHEETSRAKRRVAEVKRIREERDEMIAIICGDQAEGDLSEEDRELIGDIRLAAEHEVKRFLEENRG